MMYHYNDNLYWKFDYLSRIVVNCLQKWASSSSLNILYIMFKRIAFNMDICEGCKKTLAWPFYPCLTCAMCVCLRIVVSNTCLLCFGFVVNRLMYPILPNSLVCLFLIVPSVFSNVYLVWNVLYWVVLCISLFCH